MSTNLPRTQRQWLRVGLAHSLWITRSWDWFLELMGRAAEAILVLSVLYASVKLLPVVHLPASLDVAVFIAQFVALDVGGLSLSKLAEQAEAAHNTHGATHARWMSRALLSVLIAGVVVVALEQLFVIPADGRLAIETVLLIARSILAVFYGQTIHRLREEDAFGMSARSTSTVIEETTRLHVEEMLTIWQTRMEHGLSELAEELHQQVLTVQHEDEASLAARDEQLRHEFAQLEARLQAVLKHQSLISAKQEIPVTEARHATSAGPLPQPHVAVPRPRKGRNTSLFQAPAARPSTPGWEHERLAQTSALTAGRSKQANTARTSLAATDNETTEQPAPDR